MAWDEDDVFVWRWPTMLESSVTIVVGMIVVALLLPAVQPVRGGRRQDCRNNMKQIGLALHNYLDEHCIFPPLTMGTQSSPRSWRVSMLPLLDHDRLRNDYCDEDAWNALSNLPVARVSVSAYRCPSMRVSQDSDQRWYTAYAGVRGPNTLFPNGGARPLAEVSDGTTNTIAIVESCDQRIVWTEPRDVDLATEPITINRRRTKADGPAGLMSSAHVGGACVLLADGSVRFLSENLDPQVLQSLLSPNGGEPVVEY